MVVVAKEMVSADRKTTSTAISKETQTKEKSIATLTIKTVGVDMVSLSSKTVTATVEIESVTKTIDCIGQT